MRFQTKALAFDLQESVWLYLIVAAQVFVFAASEIRDTKPPAWLLGD